MTNPFLFWGSDVWAVYDGPMFGGGSWVATFAVGNLPAAEAFAATLPGGCVYPAKV